MQRCDAIKITLVDYLIHLETSIKYCLFMFMFGCSYTRVQRMSKYVCVLIKLFQYSVSYMLTEYSNKKSAY